MEEKKNREYLKFNLSFIEVGAKFYSSHLKSGPLLVARKLPFENGTLGVCWDF